MHAPSSNPFNTLVLGIVVDTNDPHQMGRIKAHVPAFGDQPFHDTDDLPWCYYVAPFGGTIQNNQMVRGPNDTDITEGAVSYGMWNIPKVGASVLVACIDGDPLARVWLGCIFIDQTTHTLPHGRYAYDSTDSPGEGKPEGPFSSAGKKIQPLYDFQGKAFGERTGNFEWRTRGADHSVSAFTAAFKNLSTEEYLTSKLDDEDVKFTEEDGHEITSRQGYTLSRIEPDLETNDTVKNFDSNIFCWVTPGFHAIVMDDTTDSCRMRFRTTTGHQIILDDSNERIYVSTNEGANWIEMDSDGSVDVYAQQKVSIHSEADINLTADKTVRIFGGEGVHIVTPKEYRVHAEEDIHIVSNATIRVQAADEIRMSCNSPMSLLSQDNIMIQAGGGLNLTGGSNILETAPIIHLNGPSAIGALSAEAQLAFYTNRLPKHEPWGRISTINDYSHDPKLPYNDPGIGRENKQRGIHWHR